MKGFDMPKTIESVELSAISWFLAIHKNHENQCQNGSQNPSELNKFRAKTDQGSIDSLICRVLPERKKTCFFDASPVAPKIRKIGPKSDGKAPRAPRHFAGGASRWGCCP